MGSNIYLQMVLSMDLAIQHLFSGTYTVAHPNPNGKLFVSIYGWRKYAGHSYVGGMKLNPIKIPRKQW